MDEDNRNDLVPIDKRFLPADNQELLTDLEYARKNQQQLSEAGLKAVEELANIANQSQHPRAYEVFSTLLRTVSELNRDLVDTAKTKQQAKQVVEPDPNDNGEGKVTNNLFVGTTADLQNMLEAMRNKNKRE